MNTQFETIEACDFADFGNNICTLQNPSVIENWHKSEGDEGQQQQPQQQQEEQQGNLLMDEHTVICNSCNTSNIKNNNNSSSSNNKNNMDELNSDNDNNDDDNDDYVHDDDVDGDKDIDNKNTTTTTCDEAYNKLSPTFAAVTGILTQLETAADITATTTTTTVKRSENEIDNAKESITPTQQQQQQQQEQQLNPSCSSSVASSSSCTIASTSLATAASVAAAESLNNCYSDEILLQPLSERWSPLGANYDDAMSPTSELLSPESELELLSNDGMLLDKQSSLCGNNTENANELARLRSIEDEQELLTTSLMALTSHFAHVQLRVRQIVEAPAQERDQLLRDLEDFAFQGIPDPTAITTAPKLGANAPQSPDSSESTTTPNDAARQSQCALIDQLKCQLNELEQLAYESGAPVLPQHMLLEKQKIIIDELKSKLNLQVDDSALPELSAEELKCQVDNAIGEFVGPLKMKEQLVAQLKTQITDLERFIAFLQCDSDDAKVKLLTGVGGSDKLYEAYNSYAAKKKKKQQPPEDIIKSQSQALAPATMTGDINVSVTSTTNATTTTTAATTSVGGGGGGSGGGVVRESLNSKAHGLLDKASLLMQMFASTHFSHTKQEHFQKNSLKKTSKGNHWGDLRAQLEVDIQEVASLAATLSCDREKLAHVKRVLKQQQQQQRKLSLNADSGALTTVPPAATSRRHHPGHVVTNEITAYQTTSSDSDEDAYDRYDWDKTCARRVLHMRGDSIATISKELTSVVRKNFARTLQQLIQHGLRVETESTTSSLIVPFMRCLNPMPHSPPPTCTNMTTSSAAASFSSSSSSSSSTTVTNGIGIGAARVSQQNSFFAAHMPGGIYADYDDVGRSSIFGYGRPMHAWELILEYYYLKHGDEYNNTPARKLSQSFNLDIVDAHAVTAKQSLLSAVGMIVAMHRPYKRSHNAHFKAFVCAGLNAHQLVEWLNLILSCTELIDVYYAPNSYVARTGFRDSLRSIDALTKYDFDLPVDLAIRHFRNI